MDTENKSLLTARTSRFVRSLQFVLTLKRAGLVQPFPNKAQISPDLSDYCSE